MIATTGFDAKGLDEIKKLSYRYRLALAVKSYLVFTDHAAAANGHYAEFAFVCFSRPI